MGRGRCGPSQMNTAMCDATLFTRAAVDLDRQGALRGGVEYRRERMARLGGNKLAQLSQTSTKRIWTM